MFRTRACPRRCPLVVTMVGCVSPHFGKLGRATVRDGRRYGQDCEKGPEVHRDPRSARLAQSPGRRPPRWGLSAPRAGCCTGRPGRATPATTADPARTSRSHQPRPSEVRRSRRRCRCEEGAEVQWIAEEQRCERQRGWRRATASLGVRRSDAATQRAEQGAGRDARRQNPSECADPLDLGPAAGDLRHEAAQAAQARPQSEPIPM